MERVEVADEARRRLGPVLSLSAPREYGMLARLLHPGEAIDALALGRLRGGGAVGSQRLVVATPLRILLLEKGFLTGRERLREIPWGDVTGVELTPPMSLDLLLHDERVSLHLMQPARARAAIADLVGARLDPARITTPTSGELLDLARRKLGRMATGVVEPAVMALAGILEAGENVLELVVATAGKDTGLLVASTTRLIFVPTVRLGVGESVSLPYAEIVERRLEGGALDVFGADGTELHVGSATPVQRALTIADITRARMP